MKSELYIYGYTLSYEEKSKGEETFLFLHGLFSNRYFWEPIISHFFPLGRTITLDLPGHYPGTPPDNFQSIEMDEMIEIIAEAIRKINWGKPVTFIGHSTGGLAALGVSSKYPELVTRTIAITPASHGPVSGVLYTLLLAHRWKITPWLQFFHKGFFQLPFSIETAFLPAIYEKNIFFRSSKNAHFLQEYAKWFAELDLMVMGAYLEMLNSSDIRPLASKISLPVLLLAGRHDKVVPTEHQKELALLIPSCDYYELANSAHTPTLEEKDRTIFLMKNWLEKQITPKKPSRLVNPKKVV
jgi:pimeloyl-ACP methyl ester carboxylesterase